MTIIKKISVFFAIVCVGFLVFGCEREFLDKKPRKALVVPETIEDFQAILDNVTVMNTSPALSEISADDFTISAAGWNGLSELNRSAFVWEKDLYGSLQVISDWNAPYEQVFYANVVLDGIKKIKGGDQRVLDELKGSALFFRAMAHFNLVQQFAAPYEPRKSALLPGIPVRIDPDVNTLVGRGTLQGTYNQLILDLTTAKDLLPIAVSQLSRPSKPAAAALLAQVYLHLQDYEKTRELADESLRYKNDLLTFSQLDSTLASAFPIVLPAGNKEVIFYATLLNAPFFSNALTEIDPELYASYSVGDRRKSLFFQQGNNGINRFRGSYASTVATGSNSGIFSGIAVDEVFLMRAEANVRLGALEQAREDLNHLLSERFEPADFIPIKENSPDKLLLIILAERRKELVGRGKRWQELRRLNIDPFTAKSITRNLDGGTFKLDANDARYTFPIPNQEISLNSIEQNPR